jgi:hypothetical protein
MKKYAYLVLFLAALTGFLAPNTAAQQCDRLSASAVGYRGGDGSTLAVLDGIYHDISAQLLRLKNKGANFVPTNNYPVMTNYRMTGAAADFNGDGFVDLAEGGRGTDNNGDMLDTNLAIFLSQGADLVDPTRFVFTGPFYIDYHSVFTTYEIMALGAGDYDGDGDADIAALSWQGRLWIFWNRYVEHNCVPGCDPEFDHVPTLLGDLINDGYTEFGSDPRYWRWESNIASVDVDGDGDLDLIAGVPSYLARNRWGEVVIFLNNGSGIFSRLNQVINPYGATMQYGVCGVAAADFDKDGDVDFMVGSANSDKLYFYRNDALTFRQNNQRTITIPAAHGSCTFLREGDVDNDGDSDIVLSTDGWTANPPGGYVYWYANDGTGVFVRNPIPSSGAQVSASGDLDSGALGDFDNDGDLDFFVADGNDSRNCYFFMNEILPTYVSRGTVSSKNLVPCSFIVSDYAIVAATITVRDEKPGGTDIKYYLSNSNDENGNPRWEGPVTPGVKWEFESPGDFLRWQAVFTTTDETVTPKLFVLDILYDYITKREYSRTSHAFSMVDIDPGRAGDEEVLFSASFEFPKWRGHLRSWDVTHLSLTYNRGSQLEEIKDVGATLIADAGELLRDRDWASRIVYTAYAADVDGIMNDRTDFSVANKDRIDDYLDLGVGSPEIEPLIRFVLGDNSRNWKLGDINHSSPQVLEPPGGTESMMGAGYDSFKETQKDRRKVVLAGADDGMLHCFDAVTMEELWAFIPNNLLYKLRMMRVVDPECGEYLNHQFFVDGTPTIADVYFGGSWHTIAVCGQGAGWGKAHQWYYFALDITDPLAPHPLWELTNDTMGETWSVPVIARIQSLNKWVAFFGSGYDSDGDPTVDIGNYFYAVDVENGAILKSFAIAETPKKTSPFGIQNTLPGSAETADLEADGFADSIYFGDLFGRLWKIDLTGGISAWTPVVIYRDPYYHPIFTKPAVFVNHTDETIHLYFGTGGDEKAPATAYFSFVALVVSTTTANVEWYIGPNDLATQLGINIDRKKGEFSQGERVWADPVIADRLVYIATLQGSIESINPCATLAGGGRLYSRYILGNQVGGSALTNAQGGPISFLETKQKVRSAVTIGQTEVLAQEGQPSVNKREVFIQSYTQPGTGGPEPPSQVLAQPVPQTALMIKQWREVYKVLKK